MALELRRAKESRVVASDWPADAQTVARASRLAGPQVARGGGEGVQAPAACSPQVQQAGSGSPLSGGGGHGPAAPTGSQPPPGAGGSGGRAPGPSSATPSRLRRAANWPARCQKLQLGSVQRRLGGPPAALGPKPKAHWPWGGSAGGWLRPVGDPAAAGWPPSGRSLPQLAADRPP